MESKPIFNSLIEHFSSRIVQWTKVQRIPALDPSFGRPIGVDSGTAPVRGQIWLAESTSCQRQTCTEIAVKRGCFKTLLFHVKTLHLLESTPRTR